MSQNNKEMLVLLGMLGLWGFMTIAALVWGAIMTWLYVSGRKKKRCTSTHDNDGSPKS